MTVKGVSRTNQSTPIDNEGSAAPAAASDEVPSLMLPSKADQLMNSGDLGATIAAMLIKSAASSREAAKMSKQAAIAAEDAAQQQKLQNMESAANKRLIGGFSGGLVTIASGGMALTGGLKQSDHAITSWSGNAKIADGGGQATKAIFDFNASNDDKDVAAAERKMKVAEREVTAADERERDASDLARKAIDYYKEYAATKEETRSAVILRA